MPTVQHEKLVHYGLLTPSGIVVGMGTKRPKLSRAEQRDFWKVLTFKLRRKQVVDNQHKQIKGYRDLTAEEIALMNEAKAKAVEVGELCAKIGLTIGVDKRWVAIGQTQLQQGFMALIRGIARPETF